MRKLWVFLTVFVVFFAWSVYRFQLISTLTNFESIPNDPSDSDSNSELIQGEEAATWTDQTDSPKHQNNQDNQEKVEIPVAVQENPENEDIRILTSWKEILKQLESERSDKEFSHSENLWTAGQPLNSVENVKDFKLAFEELRISLEYPGEEESMENSITERPCGEDEREAWILLLNFIQYFSSTMKSESNETCSKFTSICAAAEQVFAFPPEFYLPADSFAEGAEPQECPFYLDRRLLGIAKAVLKLKETQVCESVTTFCQNPQTNE